MAAVLLNTNQAAERCNLSPRTFEKYRVTGGGPPYIRLGSAVRYRLEDLDAWIAANRRRTTSDDPSIPRPDEPRQEVEEPPPAHHPRSGER
jgi:predicted DNA-binding transcriptional regulator AlpA